MDALVKQITTPYQREMGVRGMGHKRKIAAAMSATAVVTLIGAGGAQAQQPTAGSKAQSGSAKSGPEWRHCTDTGSAGNEFSHAKYVAAVCKGKVRVLTVNEATDPPTPVGGWRSVGGPSHVTDVSVASNTRDVSGGPVFITVLTRNGQAWEGSCTNSVPLGPCTFRQLPRPPH
jgi:hypothetical protein